MSRIVASLLRSCYLTALFDGEIQLPCFIGVLSIVIPNVEFLGTRKRDMGSGAVHWVPTR